MVFALSSALEIGVHPLAGSAFTFPLTTALFTGPR